MGVQINGSEGNVIATKGTYSGNVTIGGTLTYEDVTNIDSVGLITARNGISVTGGDVKVAAGIISASTNTDGTTDLLTLHADADGTNNGLASIKFTGNAGNHSSFIKGGHTTNGDTILTFHTDDYASGFNPEERLRIDSSGRVIIGNTSPLTDAQLTLSADDAPALAFQRTGSGKFESAIGMETDSALRFYNGADSGSISGLTERMQIDASGRVLIGTTVTTNHQRLGNQLVIAGTSAYSGASFTQYNTTAAHKTLLDFNRSKGGSIGDMTTLANNDGIAHLVFRGSDGTNFVDSAGIRCDVDKAPSSNSVKGKISIETGSTGTVNETIVATSDGHVQTPRQPYFVARAGASRDNVTDQVLVFSTAVHNNGSHYNTSTSKFTAPIAGAYIFGGKPAYIETSDTMSIVIRKNGSTIYEVERVVANSMVQHSAFGFSTLLYLAVSDEVDLYVSGQCHQNGNYSHWFGYLLG